MITIIVDANIIISGIINPFGIIPALLIKESHKVEYVLPQYALEEIYLHQNKICKIAGITSQKFNKLLSHLLKNLLIFSHEDIRVETINTAFKLAANIDTNDKWYIAYGLELDALIWTGDLKLRNGLRRKGFKNVITTKELKQIIKGL